MVISSSSVCIILNVYRFFHITPEEVLVGSGSLCKLYGSNNEFYRALETAEENARRLMQKPALVLPYPECCETKKELHISCPDCEVGSSSSEILFIDPPKNFSYYPLLHLCSSYLQDTYCSEECRVKAWQEFHSVLCFRTKVPKESHPLKVLDQFWR